MRAAYQPGRKGDPFRPSAVNVAVTRVSEADRLHPGLPPRDAVDLEVRAAFEAHPSGADVQRVLTCCRVLRRTMPGIADHLTDDHLRHLWRTRDER